ncbi:MAG: CDP-diacylglycerol--glycerol-3-phosphate 3-phosphatidyltransferase [Actinomycetota bacterium]|nr:CDP-diacylglycerol--glycerol-3-phosphate 3-phosphatidyltransferase [Actinomycetota bacterium]
MTVAPSRPLTLLNGLSAVRVAAVPVVIALVLADDVDWAEWAAAGVLAVAALTDFFDGYLARRWGEATKLGTFLDTTADKLLVSGTLIALVAVDRASAWIAFVIVGRELAIMGVRAVAAAEGTVIVPSVWGKLKANVQFLALLLAVLDVDRKAGPFAVDDWALALAAGVTVLSGADYLARFSPALGIAPRREPPATSDGPLPRRRPDERAVQRP